MKKPTTKRRTRKAPVSKNSPKNSTIPPTLDSTPQGQPLPKTTGYQPLTKPYIPFPHTEEHHVQLIQQPYPQPKINARSKSGREQQAKMAVLTTSHNKKAFLQALVQTLGVVTRAATIAGITARAHYHWMAEDEDYQEAVRQIKETTLDFFEDALYQAIKDKNVTAIIFALKTQGKKRGYIETTHTLNQNTTDDNVQFYIPDNGRSQPDTITDATIVP